MKKRNKKYKPKPINIKAHETAIKLVKPVNGEAKQTLSLDNYTALEAFAKGVARKGHFDTLASTVDVTLMLLNSLFEGSHELQLEVKQGWLGLVRARERYKTIEKIGLDGPAYKALERVCQIYDEVIENVTGYELMAFYRARDEQIAKGNYYKGNVAQAPERIAA